MSDTYISHNSHDLEVFKQVYLHIAEFQMITIHSSVSTSGALKLSRETKSYKCHKHTVAKSRIQVLLYMFCYISLPYPLVKTSKLLNFPGRLSLTKQNIHLLPLLIKINKGTCDHLLFPDSTDC